MGPFDKPKQNSEGVWVHRWNCKCGWCLPYLPKTVNLYRKEVSRQEGEVSTGTPATVKGEQSIAP